MNKNQRKPKINLFVDPTKSNINDLDLIVGDVVDLELRGIEFLYTQGFYRFHAVFEGNLNRQYSFLDLDTYIENLREENSPFPIQQISAQEDDISLDSVLWLQKYAIRDLQPWHITAEEMKSKLKLFKIGLGLLEKLYTFDKVVYVDDHNNILKVEKNKSLYP